MTIEKNVIKYGKIEIESQIKTDGWFMTQKLANPNLEHILTFLFKYKKHFLKIFCLNKLSFTVIIRNCFFEGKHKKFLGGSIDRFFSTDAKKCFFWKKYKSCFLCVEKYFL